MIKNITYKWNGNENLKIHKSTQWLMALEAVVDFPATDLKDRYIPEISSNLSWLCFMNNGIGIMTCRL